MNGEEGGLQFMLMRQKKKRTSVTSLLFFALVFRCYHRVFSFTLPFLFLSPLLFSLSLSSARLPLNSIVTYTHTTVFDNTPIVHSSDVMQLRHAPHHQL